MTAGTLDIVTAGPAHAGAIAALLAECFTEGWDASAIAAMLHFPGTTALIAGPVEDPHGFVMFRVTVDESEILSIGVRPDWRRRRVGEWLLAATFDAAAAAGAARLFLEVAEDNTAGRALYGAAGFAAVGRRRCYYDRDGAATDALILTRPLGNPPVPG